MSEKPKPLTDSKRYRDFMASRDHALESVLEKYQRAQSAIAHVLIEHIQGVALTLLRQAPAHSTFKTLLAQFRQRLAPIEKMATAQAIFLVKAQRRTIYALSLGSHAEAIGCGLGKPTRFKASAIDQRREMLMGGSIESRCELAIQRMIRKAEDAFQSSCVQGHSETETIDALDAALPKKRAVAPPRVVKLKESNAFSFGAGASEDDEEGTEIGAATQDLDEPEWEQAVDDYLKTDVPAPRGPFDKIFPAEGETGDARYAWELEQDITQDFISSVRAGENDAANQNGIEDMMWLAIIDSKTDGCCSSRDGKSTKEIESLMASGKDMGGCHETTAPAHPRCRCRMVPLSRDLPKESPPDFGSFDDWIASQGK